MSVVILLAAGSGTRFGSQKLLARLSHGERVVESSARRLLEEFPRVVAVTGADPEVRDCLSALGCDVVTNPRAAEGMGTSLAFGVAHARDAASWLIAMGDMPFLESRTLAGIETAGHIDEHIVVPQFDQFRGPITARIAELVAAGDTSLAGVTVSLGADFNRYDTESGKLVTGTTVLLTDSNGGKVTIDANTGWQTKNGTVPPSSGLHTKIEPFDPLVAVDLVTSKVILDDVGRGSNGGDLVIGGLSVGTTSNSKGVERFEIEVRDNSKLANISSTNNTLREVTIKNGTQSRVNELTIRLTPRAACFRFLAPPSAVAMRPCRVLKPRVTSTTTTASAMFA